MSCLPQSLMVPFVRKTLSSPRTPPSTRSFLLPNVRHKSFVWCVGTKLMSRIERMFVNSILLPCEAQRLFLMNKIYADRITSSKKLSHKDNGESGAETRSEVNYSWAHSPTRFDTVGSNRTFHLFS